MTQQINHVKGTFRNCVGFIVPRCSGVSLRGGLSLAVPVKGQCERSALRTGAKSVGEPADEPREAQEACAEILIRIDLRLL